MKKLPAMLTPNQQENIQKFIAENFGCECGSIAHEIESEFVHTDVQIITPKGKTKTFVTFGMSAIPTDALIEEFERTELVMSASKDFDTMTSNGHTVTSELARISKYPFEYDTWFGPGHTIFVSKQFKEKFGYDYFAFWNLNLQGNIDDLGLVSFLALVPIYSDEYDWIVQNHTGVFLDLLYEKFGDEIFNVDVPREHFVPEDDADTIVIMKALDIDKETYEQLALFLEEAEESGEEITYDLIESWMEENR